MTPENQDIKLWGGVLGRPPTREELDDPYSISPHPENTRRIVFNSRSPSTPRLVGLNHLIPEKTG